MHGTPSASPCHLHHPYIAATPGPARCGSPYPAAPVSACPFIKHRIPLVTNSVLENNSGKPSTVGSTGHTQFDSPPPDCLRGDGVNLYGTSSYKARPISINQFIAPQVAGISQLTATHLATHQEIDCARSAATSSTSRGIPHPAILAEPDRCPPRSGPAPSPRCRQIRDQHRRGLD